MVPEVVRSTAGAFASILYCFHNESVSVGRVAGGYTGWRRVDSSMILLLELPEKRIRLVKRMVDGREAGRS